MARRPRSSKRERQDAHETVTARITAALERGTVPWRAPRRARGHRNALSGRPYRGINLLMLGLTALERSFEDARWLTYRQAGSRGGHVRRDERGTRVVLWKWIEHEDPEDGELARNYPLLRLFTLFNVAQCDGLELSAPDADEPFDPAERAEAIISGYAGGPAILHDATAAYYRPSRDEVHLPPRAAFSSADGYYATTFHELGHSTGHPSRLGRTGYESGVAAFGSETYSREELVAEFAAAFLSHEAGIDPSHLDQSAAYIRSRLHALRDDHRMVIVAAGLGQRAADHILGRSPETSNETSKEEQ
jgi:antirestriction protein ArdC